MKRRLGRTGYDVFPLGLGGHTYPIGHGPQFFTTPEQRASLVSTLVKSGVNYFDTTWINEVQSLADSFQRTGIGDESFVSLQYVGGFSDNKWKTNLRLELETRLSIMEYSSAPLFLMGLGDAKLSYQDLVDGCEAMTKLRDEGMIKNIGISCHNVESFPLITKLIQETDMIDYMMVRFNWKDQHATEELFPTAKDHDVGIVVMKIFCWDCGPEQWGRRISVFEPISDEERYWHSKNLTPSQRSLIWTLQNAPDAVVVPAINTMWEVEQNLSAIDSLSEVIDSSDFTLYLDRLWSKEKLFIISEHAESKTIRDRAKALCGALNINGEIN